MRGTGRRTSRRRRPGGWAGRGAPGTGPPLRAPPRAPPPPSRASAPPPLWASAGVMAPASHNPAADNGYKLYLSDGAQVIPPADAEIEKRIAALGPLAQIPVAAAGSPLITRHGDEGAP